MYFVNKFVYSIVRAFIYSPKIRERVYRFCQPGRLSCTLRPASGALIASSARSTIFATLQICTLCSCWWKCALKRKAVNNRLNQWCNQREGWSPGPRKVFRIVSSTCSFDLEYDTVPGVPESDKPIGIPVKSFLSKGLFFIIICTSLQCSTFRVRYSERINVYRAQPMCKKY